MIILAGMKGNEKYTIHSVEKACDILLSFNEDNLELGVTELSQKLGLTKSTVHKLLITLEHKGLMVQKKENGKYGLSIKLFELANYYLNSIDINSTVKPYMEELSDEFKETVHFAVLDENEVVYVEKIEGKYSVNIYSKIGRRSPLHCLGVGKAIMANLPPEKLEQVLAHGLKTYTKHTIIDRLRMLAELEKVRKNSYAIDNEEYEEGIRCIGVPVRNSLHELIGAISVTGPVSRMTDEKIRQIIPKILAHSVEIAKKLGNRCLS